jgi:hypothetical protein
MCFSKEFSFFNFGLLAGYAAYLQMYSTEKDIWKLYVPLFYLGLKDFLQGFLYIFDKVEIYKYYLSILSYVHICFQSLFANIFFSFFSPFSNFFNVINFWNSVFIFNFIFGLYQLTNLDVFDIFKEAPYCKDKLYDFCSDKNGSYIGKYHVAYKFRTKYKYSPLFYLFIFMPALFTNSYILSIISAMISGLLVLIIFQKIRGGEQAAIWCLLNIIFFLPVAYYRKEVLELIETIKIY